MPNKLFILVLVWSALFAAWTFASPPSGTPGGAFSGLYDDGAGNIGIKTNTPATLLDINGTTTIRGSLDMINNRIQNVAAPIAGLDAVNKAYVDSLVGSMSTTMKLWGEGRPNANVINTAGECVNGAIKVSRSTRLATWDGAQAACPANWWVCSAAERGTLVCPPPSGTNKNIVYCNVTASSIGDSVEDFVLTTSDWGWVSNTATTTLYFGKIARGIKGGAKSDQYTCNLLPVWCCSQ